jgi:hypothetical protein
MEVVPPKDTRPYQSEPVNTTEPTLLQTQAEMPVKDLGVEAASGHNSTEPDADEPRRKRRSNGHVRRISINVKTGEVVERTLEGCHGVYGL